MATALDAQTLHGTDEDRAYAGSRFADVVAAICCQPVSARVGRRRRAAAARLRGHVPKVFGGLIFGATRTVPQPTANAPSIPAPTCAGAPIAKDFARLVHPNGVCLIGPLADHRRHRRIRLLPQGQHGADGRALLDLLHRDAPRPHAVAVDGRQALSHDRPGPRAPLRTANFITQEDIGGADTDVHQRRRTAQRPGHHRLAPRRSAPRCCSASAWCSVASIRQPTIRQLYQIAELGKPAGGTDARARSSCGCSVAADQPRIAGADLDFRDEIMAQIFDRGDPVPKRTLTFTSRSPTRGESTGPGLRLAPHVSELAADRRAGVRQRRHLLQRRLGDSFQSPDLARGSERSVDRDADRREEGAVVDSDC